MRANCDLNHQIQIDPTICLMYNELSVLRFIKFSFFFILYNFDHYSLNLYLAPYYSPFYGTFFSIPYIFRLSSLYSVKPIHVL